MGNDATGQLRSSAVLAELARRGVDTNREALLELSDRLGVADRPVTVSGGFGNRRWSPAGEAVRPGGRQPSPGPRQ